MMEQVVSAYVQKLGADKGTAGIKVGRIRVDERPSQRVEVHNDPSSTFFGHAPQSVMDRFPR